MGRLSNGSPWKQRQKDRDQVSKRGEQTHGQYGPTIQPTWLYRLQVFAPKQDTVSLFLTGVWSLLTSVFMFLDTVMHQDRGDTAGASPAVT